MLSNKTHELERAFSSYCGQNYSIALGRAACGIALTLRCLGQKLKIEKGITKPRIALPAFLCQSPLGAIISENWEPVFCDIHLETAMVPVCQWEKVIHSKVNAILLVHMFGNPDNNIQIIAKICRENNIFLLEDACLALGAQTTNGVCGAWGDAAFFSFGHTKLIHVGSGGLMVTKHQWLEQGVREYLDCLNTISLQERKTVSENFLSKFYEAKNLLTINEAHAKKKFSGLIKQYLPLVLQKWNADNAANVLTGIENLSQIVEQRRQKANLYLELINAPIQVIGMQINSAPWRFVFRIPGISRIEQGTLSDSLRQHGVHVSNWYLPLQWIHTPENRNLSDLSQTEILSREIFQLWLDEDSDMYTIAQNATIFSNCFKSWRNKQ